MRPLSVDPALGYDATGDEGSLSNVTKMVGAQTLWAAGYTGKGVDVALIDTGVAPVVGLSDKIVNGPDLSLDYQYGLAESVDAYGHGTHMAGIIAGRDPGTTVLSDPSKFVGVAPDARIVNVKVGAADGSTDVSQVIAGIDWVVQHRNDNGLNIKVLNLSFGTISGQPYTVDPLAFAAEVAWKKGVVVVAAAGNDGLGIKQLADPAYDPRILAVGATDPNNSTQSKNWMPADFTNAGSSKRDADLFAPGLHILSLRDPGSYVDSNYPNSVVGTRFTRGSGTSQAAAVTSGLVADLFQKYPTATPDQIKNALIESTIEFKTGLRLGSEGSGRSRGNGQRFQGHQPHDARQGHPELHGGDRHRIARDGPRRAPPLQRHDRAHRRVRHLRQRLERSGLGHGLGRRHLVERWPLERQPLDRRRLGRAAVVERHLDRQRLDRTALERPAVVGARLGRSALERPAVERRRVGRTALERRRLGRPALERPGLVVLDLGVGPGIRRPLPHSLAPSADEGTGHLASGRGCA